MRTPADSDDQGRAALGWLGPLFGEAWSQRPLDLMSDRIKSLAATGMLNPRSLRPNEIQAMAAAIMAHVVNHEG